MDATSDSRLNLTIHFDLDGVLADFRRGFVERIGERPEAFPVDEMWKRVAAVPRFFQQLPVMPGAHEMLSFAASIGTSRILTAIPRLTTYPTATEEKHYWVRKNLGDIPVTVVRYARQKTEYAHPRAILVDDTSENVQRWIKAGGIGIIHVSAKETMFALQNQLHSLM